MSGPLDGVRVVDLSIVWAGPHATRALADLGAEVIKVESTTRMDPVRGPAVAVTGREGAYPGHDGGDRPYNRHGYFIERNRSKYGVTIDLKRPAGIALLTRLVAISDVVIDNFAYGVMDRLGLGYDDLRAVKPGIIQVSMPSFGMSGPERDYVGFGATNDQLSGLVSITGYGPDWLESPGINASDPIAGMHAAIAVMAALVHRHRSGEGQLIDLSHRESATRLLGPQVLNYAMNGRVAAPTGNASERMAPHGVYRCAPEIDPLPTPPGHEPNPSDAWVAIACRDDAEWRALCDAMGRPHLAGDARFADLPSRLREREALDAEIAAWTRPLDRYDAMRRLQAAGVPAAPVLSAARMFADPHLRARGFIVTIPHDDVGPREYQGMPWRLAETPGTIPRGAPLLGQHNRLVFGGMLGLSDDDLAELERSGIIGERPAGAPAH